MPDEPPTDAITDHIISVYCAADRGRRVVAGMGAAVPLPLSVSDITAVVEVYGSPLPRRLLDAAVFELDGVVLENKALPE